MSLEDNDGTNVEINLIILFNSKEERGTRPRRLERTNLLTRTEELRPVNFERGLCEPHACRRIYYWLRSKRCQ